jgi:hypothetical protein
MAAGARRRTAAGLRVRFTRTLRVWRLTARNAIRFVIHLIGQQR